MITRNTREIPSILVVMESIGFTVFRGVNSINLVGVRTASRQAGRFDDWIVSAMRQPCGRWITKWYPATTDPGVPWLVEPMNSKGAAVFPHGQIRGCFKWGLHLGDYRCLVQAKPIGMLRDGNRNELIDPVAGLDIGYHAIQLHRASATRAPVKVGKYSAGCQVVQDPDDYDDLITDLDVSITKYGSTVSYSLIDVAQLSTDQVAQISVGLLS